MCCRVRESAMQAVVRVGRLLLGSAELPDADASQLLTLSVAALLKQALERISRVRQAAAGAAQQLLHCAVRSRTPHCVSAACLSLQTIMHLSACCRRHVIHSSCLQTVCGKLYFACRGSSSLGLTSLQAMHCLRSCRLLMVRQGALASWRSCLALSASCSGQNIEAASWKVSWQA